MLNCAFKTLSPESCKKSAGVIIDSFEYHPERGEREKAILAQTISDATLSTTKIAVITDITRKIKGKLGLVALSASEVILNSNIYPSITIDYLFVDNRYRKNVQEHFDMRVSEMLLAYAIQSAMTIAKLAGVRYLILRPDGGKEHQSLIDFYESMEFRYMTDKHEWMLLKLS